MPKKLCRIWTARDNGADTELLDETRKMQRDHLGVTSEKKCICWYKTLILENS